VDGDCIGAQVEGLAEELVGVVVRLLAVALAEVVAQQLVVALVGAVEQRLVVVVELPQVVVQEQRLGLAELALVGIEQVLVGI